jgi:acetyltransferase-like isoleucine patch superfamily enzyme
VGLKKIWLRRLEQTQAADDPSELTPVCDPTPHDRRFMLGQSLVSLGRYTYGFKPDNVHHWNQGAALNIGAFCSLADSVTILLGGEHQLDKFTTYPFGHHPVNEKAGWRKEVGGFSGAKGAVTIGNDVWIGLGATIMSGVTVGDGAVIAANAHVFRNVDPYAIVGGNPAATIRPRFDKSVQDLLLELAWWTLPDASIREISNILYCEKPTMELLLPLIEKYRKKPL